MASDEQVARLEAENAALRERVRELEARLADLEERVRRTPRNSSMPPSAEGFSKPPVPNRAQRRAEKRRQGKQPGDEGRHRAQVKDPTEVVTHEPMACPHCGTDLSSAGVAGVDVRQVLEVEIRRHVTEHRMEVRRCSCGCEAVAEAPQEATAPACYGPGVRALACYLAIFQHIPYDRMAQFFSDVLGLSVSTGALVKMVHEGGGRLGFFSDVVRDLLKEAPADHFDETGARVTVRLHWVHVASTALVTLFECHERRGTVAMEEMGVIEKMTGVAIHDGWKPYRAYDVVHALCNAHSAERAVMRNSA
jgi:transposase